MGLGSPQNILNSWMKKKNMVFIILQVSKLQTSELK